MSCLKRVWKKLFGKQQIRVLLVGLDAAGKTTLLYHLIGNQSATIPTIGFNVETVHFPPIEFVVWDVSGQDKLRTFWRHYYHGTSGLIFVVDTNDRQRLELVRQELEGILQEEELQEAVVLILANKIDLPNSASNDDLNNILNLSALSTHRPIHIQRCQATNGTGVREGLTWLAQQLQDRTQRRKGKGNTEQHDEHSAESENKTK